MTTLQRSNAMAPIEDASNVAQPQSLLYMLHVPEARPLLLPIDNVEKKTVRDLVLEAKVNCF